MGSPARIELERRYDWLEDAVGRMNQDADDNWWDGPERPGLSSSASRLALNGTVRESDSTVA